MIKIPPTSPISLYAYERGQKIKRKIRRPVIDPYPNKNNNIFKKFKKKLTNYQIKPKMKLEFQNCKDSEI